MKHTHLLLVLVGLLTTPGLRAQQDNNWYFGQKAGLNFSTGRPIAITNSAMNTMEGSSSVSDENGQLLFYTNGITVWNRNNQQMPHGVGLLGDQSTTQGAIIIPKPDSSSHYYIFAADDAGGPNGLTYSEVDMAADNGKGDVIVKNTHLVSPVSEKITAIYNANGHDIWVTTHKWGNNAFYSYKVTASGVEPTPVISNVGLAIEGDDDSGHYAGWMTFSPDGKHLASASGLLAAELFDFDNATGIVSNAQIIKSPAKCYGAAFSANSKKLYLTSDNDLFQYDMTASNIAASQTQIATLDVASSLRLAPDSKIYVVSKYLATSMSVINNPDEAGVSCKFVANVIDLGGKQTFVGLPNFIVTPYYLLDIDAVKDCSDGQVSFTALGTLPNETVTWDFGDGSELTTFSVVHTYAQSGTYNVKAKAKNNKTVRYLSKDITISKAPVAHQPENMITCGTPEGTAVFNLADQNVTILGNQPKSAFKVDYYATQEDATAATNVLPLNYTNTTSPQTIYARVSVADGDCYAVTSFTITATPSPEVTMNDTYSFCEDSYIVIDAPEGFDAYVWLYNDKVVSNSNRVSVSKAGEYTLRVTKNYNGFFCNTTKTIQVQESAKPIIKNIEVSDMSEDNNSIEVVTVSTGDYEYSVDGSNYQDSPVFNNLKSGEYTVTVKDKNGCGMAEGETLILMYPKYFTPNGDGHHDKWQVENAWRDLNMSVTIFDRYGKIMAAFKGNSSGWDGTYNGNELPASDYWFVITRDNGKEYKGHFSMMR